MKLFVAVIFTDPTKARLLSLSDELRLYSSRGSFTRPENLHLTLAFLGECDEEQTAAAKAVIDSIRLEPIRLIVESIGYFRRDGGDIWWAGVREDKGLLELQRELTEKLIAASFILDRRTYSPHITLGRKVVTDWTPHPIETFGETVTSIDLMKSEQIGGKLTYTKIHERRANHGTA